MPQPENRLSKSLFAEALALPVESRREFLARACRGDDALRAEVEALLAAHEGAPEFLKEPTIPRGEDPSPEEAGSRLGPYKLLERIGEGGFGTVYMAEQEVPIRRRVAVKVLKPGMDSRAVIARFEAERQALALMDHPNIARVLDAGTTASGRPYFVMELVKGVPITKYCDEAHLSTAERLAVFLPVCHAVQHAHQKGIIHRDLKPSNVLVTLHDGRPVPKVIDFGIAKALEQRLTEKTLFTAFGQMIGTPAYMSPEQAEMSGLDIDTRSDVYSLGVLLYEILAGAPPFDPERLRDAGIVEILRIIKEEEPPKPSTKVSTLGDVLASVAARHATEPKKLGALLRGDLDWVVMKALSKERQRRYDSASSLAHDLERYLAHEPVSAGPPGWAYRASKFVRRNRVGVGAGALLALALLGGIAGTGLALLRARDAERAAKTNADDAHRKFEIAREGADLLLFNVVRELPKVLGTRELQRRILDAALKHYEKLAAEKPGDVNEQRRIWVAFGELSDAYLALGEKPRAYAALDRYRELVTPAAAAHPGNRLFQIDLAVSFERTGQRARVEARIEDATAAFAQERALLEPLLAEDPDDPAVQRALAYAYRLTAQLHQMTGEEAASLEWQRKSMALFEKLSAAFPTDALLLHELAFALERLAPSAPDPDRQFERAAALVDRIAALEGESAANQRLRAFFLTRRAHADIVAVRASDAAAHARAARQILDGLIAAEPRNPQFKVMAVEVLVLQGDAAEQLGRLDESHRYYTEAEGIAANLELNDDASVDVLFNLANSACHLASTAEERGEISSARTSLERASRFVDELLARAPDNFGHLDLAATTHQSLTRLLAQLGEIEAAREHLRKSDAASRRALELAPDEDRFKFLRAHTQIVQSDFDFTLGDAPAAEASARAALAWAEQLIARQPRFPKYLSLAAEALDRLGNIADRGVQLAEETRLRRRGLEYLERALAIAPENPMHRFNYANTLNKLAGVLLQTGPAGEAKDAFARAIDAARALVTAEPASVRFRYELGRNLRGLGLALQGEGDLEGAHRNFAEFLEVSQAIVAAEPQVIQYRASLTDAYEALSATSLAQRKETEARDWMVRCIDERRRLAQLPGANTLVLNGAAWILLTCEFADLRDPKVALELARRASELERGSEPGSLDTLALAYFENGEVARAIETQERALALIGAQDPGRRARFQSRLERYRAGGK